MYVPIFSKAFIEKVDYLIEESENELLNSKGLYLQAENLLLQEIGLKDFEPSKEGINVKSFKDSFLSSGRLDAQILSTEI